MFDRIVIALDGSPEAGSAGLMGLQIAARFHSEVTGLSVIDVRVVEGPAVETLAPLWGEVTGRPFQPEVMRLYRERADATVASFERTAESLGVSVVHRRVEIGVAEETILEHALGADLLVMGRRGEHAGFGRQVVGTTLWRVLHRSPCPVLVGGDHDLTAGGEEIDGGRIPQLPLLAWDCSPGGRAALSLAIRYASATDVELRLVHAGGESSDGSLDEAHEALAAAGVSWESARLDVSPSVAVAEAAARWGTDCLLMGAFGRGRLRDFLFGSHTAEILQRVSGPVFVTPGASSP